MSEPEKETIKESFNEGFCAQLEYHLTRTFSKSQEKLKGFWCDGVLIPFVESQLKKENLIGAKKIVTTAWLGYDGQSEYEMTIKFGEYSLNRYVRGYDLVDCLLSEESMVWITLDMERKTIELQLK